jgi:hypothetical protein
MNSAGTLALALLLRTTPGPTGAPTHDALLLNSNAVASCIFASEPQVACRG